ncbi:adenosine monophosphate transferase FICD like [Fusarium denticulatum]|uniref:Adenosine monophosphate transferase FICD like n=1 Tax=Fusarium denticulatum TaxID=48507 RepID=A0A8H5U820_9HYPO|nr:adenosine monophosphate transferase FICD like [Fusarium denticulatum]
MDPYNTITNMGPNLGHSIHLMLSSSLQGNGSIRIRSAPSKESTLLLTQDDAHYEDDAEDESHADEDHIELKNYLDDFADALKKRLAAEIDEILNEKLSEIVYGSNMIEAAGSSLNITSELCRDIFTGGIDADDVEISDHDPTYKAIQTELIEKFQRGFHSFPHQSTVPKAIRDLTTSLKADIATAESAFVNIHPFLDGNSRTSRLILNTILLKYGGCFVWFGKDAMEREEYLDIAAEGFAAEAMAMEEDMDDLPEGFKPKHHKKLATFTLKHVYTYLSLFQQ